MSNRCGTICSTQIPTIPISNKESSCKLIFTPERHMLYEILFTVFQHMLYVKHNLQFITPLHRVCKHVLREVGLCYKSRELN